MPAPRFHLEDQTGTLTDTQKRAVERALAAAGARTGVECDVLVLASVSGRDFRRHAVRERTRVSADYANSILVVVTLVDRHVEIATSPRHGALFTPAATAQLLRNSAVPLLRNGRVAEGIIAAVNAIADLLTEKGSTAHNGAGPNMRQSAALVFVAAIGLGIAALIGYQACRNRICRGCGAWGRHHARTVLVASPGQDGLEEHTFQCPRCKTNYHWQTSVSYSTSSDSSSGDSFSSDSGSSDGGGGADF